jgi:hypothetical protein
MSYVMLFLYGMDDAFTNLARGDFYNYCYIENAQKIGF